MNSTTFCVSLSLSLFSYQHKCVNKSYVDNILHMAHSKHNIIYQFYIEFGMSL